MASAETIAFSNFYNKKSLIRIFPFLINWITNYLDEDGSSKKQDLELSMTHNALFLLIELKFTYLKKQHFKHHFLLDEKQLANLPIELRSG